MAETRPVQHLIIAKISKTFAFGGTVELAFKGRFPWNEKSFYETPSYYYQSRSLTSPARVAVTFLQKFGKKRVRGADKRSNVRFNSRLAEGSNR